MGISEIVFISLAFLLVTWSFAIVFLPDELDTLLDFIDETIRKIYRKVRRG